MLGWEGFNLGWWSLVLGWGALVSHQEGFASSQITLLLGGKCTLYLDDNLLLRAFHFVKLC